MTKDIEKVKHISSRMEKFCIALMALIPVVVIWSWLDHKMARALGFYDRVAYPVDDPSTLSLIGGFMLTSVLAVLVIGALYHLKQFFKAGANGEFFTADGVEGVNKAAKYFVLFSFLSIPVETAMGVIMTINNPVGQRIIGVSFQTYDLAIIFLSFVLFAISWVLKESVLIAEENAQIV